MQLGPAQNLVFLAPEYGINLLSCILVVVRADTHNPSDIATLPAKHLGDCDGKAYKVMYVTMCKTEVTWKQESTVLLPTAAYR